MQLVHSALKPTNQSKNTTENILIKHKAYETTCKKYEHEIAAIQKYIPNWEPKFYY